MDITIESFTGLPIVTADTAQETVQYLGLTQWRTLSMHSIQEFLKSNASEEDLKTAQKFAPEVQILVLEKPDGEQFIGARSTGRDWVTGFCLIDTPCESYVVVVAQYKHGADQITWALPSGVINNDDRKTYDPELACGRREFEEKTGIRVGTIDRLSEHPRLLSGGNSTLRYQPVIIHPHEPLTRITQHLDPHEQLVVVLFKVEDWIAFLEQGNGIEASAEGTTLLALRHLGI